VGCGPGPLGRPWGVGFLVTAVPDRDRHAHQAARQGGESPPRAHRPRLQAGISPRRIA